MLSYTPVTPAAILQPACSYELSGDWLTFHLSLQVLDPARVAAQPWAVQLWATPAGATARPIKVAELALDSANLLTAAQCSGTVPALPPAGSSPCRWTLLLVAGLQGLTDLHHTLELGTAPGPLQPALDGDVTWHSEGSQAWLTVDRIHNPRAADNLSGTLVLEVWSLAEPYQGGSWWGVPVASVVLGSLAGQDGWTAVAHSLHVATPAQEGHLTLMLREWTPCGYLTRDYRSLAAAPAVAQAPAPAAPELPAIPQEVAPTPAPAPLPTPQPPKVVKAVKAGKAAKTAAATRQPTADTRVSINRASAAELLTVKGIGPALAQAIIAARPLVNVDDLGRVKGLGGKLLDKIRSHVRL